VGGRPARVRDRFYDAVAFIGLPAPGIVRAVVSAALLVGVATSATVASAESLPDQPLYPVKLATEEVRLALALTPEDRAAVLLSMADHRLSEAQSLAFVGNEPEAIVASTTYGADLASAAAELAAVDSSEASATAAPIVAQLRQRLADQQRAASRVAAQLANDPAGAALVPVFQTVASLPPSAAPGMSLSETIAQHAADVAAQLAVVADREAVGSSDKMESPAAASAATRPSGPPAQPSARTAAAPAASPETRTPEQPPRPAAAGEPRLRAPAHVDPRAAEEAARRAKHEAEKALEAAKKAKEVARKHPAPNEFHRHSDEPKGAEEEKGE
jgi:uncharacterized protein DUF5667